MGSFAPFSDLETTLKPNLTFWAERYHELRFSVPIQTTSSPSGSASNRFPDNITVNYLTRIFVSLAALHFELSSSFSFQIFVSLLRFNVIAVRCLTTCPLTFFDTVFQFSPLERCSLHPALIAVRRRFRTDLCCLKANVSRLKTRPSAYKAAHLTSPQKPAAYSRLVPGRPD